MIILLVIVLFLPKLLYGFLKSFYFNYQDSNLFIRQVKTVSKTENSI